MKRTLMVLLAVSIALSFSGCNKNKKHKEKYYQTQLCNELDGVMEQSLLDRTRIDCLTDEYAIEVDFSKKWAESVGQSLYYAEMTGKKPAVGLIVKESKKGKAHLKRLMVLAEKYDIKVFKIERGE